MTNNENQIIKARTNSEMNQKCLFCGQDCIKEFSQFGGEYFYNCTNHCGKYFAEESLENNIVNYNEYDKEVISNFLRNRSKNDFHEILTKEYLDKILESHKEQLIKDVGEYLDF